MTRTRNVNFPSEPCSQVLMNENQDRFTEIWLSKFKLSATASSTTATPTNSSPWYQVTAAKFRFSERIKLFIILLSKKIEGFPEASINKSHAFQSTAVMPDSFQCQRGMTSRSISFLFVVNASHFGFRNAKPRGTDNQNQQQEIGNHRQRRRACFAAPFHLVLPCRNLKSPQNIICTDGFHFLSIYCSLPRLWVPHF